MTQEQIGTLALGALALATAIVNRIPTTDAPFWCRPHTRKKRAKRARGAHSNAARPPHSTGVASE